MEFQNYTNCKMRNECVINIAKYPCSHFDFQNQFFPKHRKSFPDQEFSKIITMKLSLFQGDRLSHAVGCAFAICLEKKQKRDQDCAVTMNFDNSSSSFTRIGSFRQATLTERLADPQVMITYLCHKN